MGNGNCYVCGKEIEADDDLDDTLAVEIEGERVADNEKDGAEVLLCAACEKKLQQEAEKVNGNK